MTALKAKDVERFLSAPDDKVICTLIYGPEQGLVHDRAERLAKQVAEDLSDPWRVMSLSDQEAGDAARLTDEVAAQSFLGGKRVIRVRGAGAATGSAVASMLKAADAGTLKAAAMVIVEAGDLKKSSALRKACEASPYAVAVPCYVEGARDAKAAIAAQCAEEGLTFTPEAADLLAQALSDDRGILRQEVEKLILFVGPSSVRGGAPCEVTAEDVRGCLAVDGQDDSFEIASLALSGRPDALSAALAQAEAAGTSVISLLRLAQNRILRLLPAAEAMARGAAPAAAMKAIKPPVFFKEQDAVARQLSNWLLPHMQRALKALFEAEAACKKTGAPDQALAERTLLSLSMRGRR